MGWQKDEIWYFTKEDGTKATGWLRDGDRWYFLQSDGSMKTGWVFNENKWFFLSKQTTDKFYKGQMCIGWIKDNDKYYYLNSDGSMVSNCKMIIEGKEYKFNSSGEWENSLVSDECINSIKSWEGFWGTPYYDEVGVLTLGYGMTGEEIQGISEVTEEQATAMLKDWINRKYAPIIKEDLDNKGIILKQNEFDALVSFAYNCGTAGLLGSTLYKRICAGVRDSSLIANFQAWSSGGGQRIEGLYRRRTKEAAMFLNGDYSGNN